LARPSSLISSVIISEKRGCIAFIVQPGIAFASVRSPQLLFRPLGQGLVMFMKYLPIAV